MKIIILITFIILLSQHSLKNMEQANKEMGNGIRIP